MTLAAGADVKDTNRYRGTALIPAAHHGHVEVVQLLLTTAIDKDHVNNLGWTALLEAVILGDGGPTHTEIVRRLVMAGADVAIADRDGVTPLEHAKRRGYGEMAAVLSPPAPADRLRPCRDNVWRNCAGRLAESSAEARLEPSNGEAGMVRWTLGLLAVAAVGRAVSAQADVARGDLPRQHHHDLRQLPHAEGTAGRDRRQGFLRRSVAGTNRHSRSPPRTSRRTRPPASATGATADIKKALIDGVRPNGVPLAPIMPSAFYAILTPAMPTPSSPICRR